MYITYRLYNLEVMNTSSNLDATFAALADPTRRAILARLAQGEASVLELAKPFDMSQPAISKHLRVLAGAGLISESREAQRRPRRLEAKPLADAARWLEQYRQFWEVRFQRLDALLDQIKILQSKAGDANRRVNRPAGRSANRRTGHRSSSHEKTSSNKPKEIIND
jgi:DNA-binding transcriptional ArsR family regulator